MIRKTRHIGLIAALSIGLMGTAHAQDSAVIDATATINDPVVPLAVTGARSLSFGVVNKPIEELGGAACYYSLGVRGPDTVRPLYQAAASSGAPQTYAPGNPTLGCDGPSSEGLSSGHFAVTCTPDVTIGLAVEHVVNPTLAATAAMNRALDDSTILVTEAGQQDVLASDLYADLWTTCQGGSLDVWVGGTLAVTTATPTGSEVSVGSITLNAYYE